MKMKRSVTAALIGVSLLAQSASAGVMVAGSEADYAAAAVGREYAASFFEIGGPTENRGMVTYLDLPWTTDPWVMGPKHALDWIGSEVNKDYEARFGLDSLGGPFETIGLSDYRLKGTGGLYSDDDIFLARLDHAPTGIDPIPLYLEDFTSGMEGWITGAGDLYYGDGTFVGYNGELQSGVFRVKDVTANYVGATLYQPGHPLFDPMELGGSPGMSGSPIEMMMSSGEPGVALMANFVEFGFHWGQSTEGLRMDIVDSWIYNETIPEPATMSMLLIGGVLVIRRRR